MALFGIIALVVLLYARTINYFYVIDDNVKRNGYMYEVPLAGPPPEHWGKKPPKYYRIFMIGMHCVNVTVIYLIWGWAPALLFAVHPIGVWGTAWVTGNYYATTAYFCLIAYYLLHVFPNVYGALGAMALYTAALNSTVCCITFPFLFLFVGTPWGLALFFPLAMYLRGHRFRTGIKTRLDFNRDKPNPINKSIGFLGWRRGVLMTKVVARYIHICFMPEKQGFFRLFGRCLHDDQKRFDWAHKMNREFWDSLLLCLGVFIGGLYISPVGTMWFFVIVMLHSQWNLTGQFFAERYAYLPIVGLCIVAGTVLQHYPIAMTVVVTYLVYKTYKFIPVWENQQKVWENDVVSFPENASCHNNLAQWYMNVRGKQNQVPVFRINEVAMLLQKAKMMEPNAWEISMNMACFAAMTNDVKAAIKWTNVAIEQLEPIAGGSGQFPLSRLKEQKKSLEKKLKEAEDKQKQGEANLSPPPIKEEDNDKVKEENITKGVPEPVGAVVS